MFNLYYTYGPNCGIKCVNNNVELWNIKHDTLLSDEMIKQIKILYNETYEPNNKYYVYTKAKNKYDNTTIWMPYDNDSLKKWLDTY